MEEYETEGQEGIFEGLIAMLSVLESIFLFFLLILIVLLIVGLILHVLAASGLSKMAEKSGKGNISPLVWIPYFGMYVMFKVVEEDVNKKIGKHLGFIF